jgi:hypothetical protein
VNLLGEFGPLCVMPWYHAYILGLRLLCAALPTIMHDDAASLKKLVKPKFRISCRILCITQTRRLRIISFVLRGRNPSKVSVG